MMRISRDDALPGGLSYKEISGNHRAYRKQYRGEDQKNQIEIVECINNGL